MQFNNIQYEKAFYDQGIKYIVGIDEVGRGPIAGPMVVCGVILDLDKIFKPKKASAAINNDVYTQVTDSKKLTDKKRREISKILLNEVLDYSIITVENTAIDLKGLAKATQEAFYTAATTFGKVSPQFTLTDAFSIKRLPKEKQTNIIRGDSLSISIGAASIIGKVYRDDLMIGYHEKFPNYGFDKHKGYGTAAHLKAVYLYGVCPIHRRSFEPIKSLVLQSQHP